MIIESIVKAGSSKVIFESIEKDIDIDLTLYNLKNTNEYYTQWGYNTGDKYRVNDTFPDDGVYYASYWRFVGFSLVYDKELYNMFIQYNDMMNTGNELYNLVEDVGVKDLIDAYIL